MAISVNYNDIKHKVDWYLQWLRETRLDTVYYTDESGIETKLPPIVYDEPREYEVWAEGYIATGEDAGPTLLGKAMARNFGQACHIVMASRYLAQAKKEIEEQHKRLESVRWDYEPYRFTHWGLRLFWNEQLATKSKK